MAIQRTIEIDGKPVAFKASAALPRLYRTRYRRDLFKDLMRLQGETRDGDAGDSGLNIESLEIFEDIAYLMARYADPSVPETPEAWLDQFETFSIYQVLPEILTLWGLNMEAQVQSKKNLDQLTAR